jgi:phosphoglycerate kinase
MALERRRLRPAVGTNGPGSPAPFTGQGMGMRLPTLEDLPDVAGRHALVRCDFNVPLSDGRISDDTRIRAALPTLQWLVESGALVTACSHLGRPKGRPDPLFDMGPVRERLLEMEPAVRLLDNLRFDPGEESNNPAFVDRIVAGQELYVDDAFACAHRAHASIIGPPVHVPSAAGRLLVKEVEILSGLLDRPNRPFVAVLGGAKVADKVGVVEALLEKADKVLVGGAMAFSFLAAAGHTTGDSIVDSTRVDRCRALLTDPGLVLPVDLVVARTDDPERVKKVGQSVPDGWRGLDIGARTASRFAEIIGSAGTILWNGPMGRFEDGRFAFGTQAIAEAVALSTAFTVVGGGDTIAAVGQLGLSGRIDHISTGGGAMLEFVECGDLPGLQALRDSAKLFTR